MILFKNLIATLRWQKVNFNESSQIITCFKTCNFSSKTSYELFPEVEELLSSGDMKHRKHPGVKRVPPIILPQSLVNAVDNLITNDNEKKAKIEGKKLLQFLSQRRLPLEKEEVEARIRNIVGPDSNDHEEVPFITKQQMSKIKRQFYQEFHRWKPLEYTKMEGLAYLVTRLAPNYAAAAKVFSAIKSELPSLQPKTFFDFGSGVGSALWAAHTVWGESLSEYFCVDASPDMNEISDSLNALDESSDKKLINTVNYRQFLPASSSIDYDVVVSAFSLLDLPSTEDRVRVIDILWRKTKDILVVIEFGNLAGFFSVLDARDYVLQLENQEGSEPGAHVLMPCPHDSPCPMLQSKSGKACGIYVTYESLFPRHRQIVKHDWISYVVLKKGPRPKDSSPWPRIVLPLLKRSAHVHCRVCCADGQINCGVVTRRRHGRHTYRCVRSSNIGDTLPINISSLEPAELSEEIVNEDEHIEEPT